MIIPQDVYRLITLFKTFVRDHCSPGLMPLPDFAEAFAVYAIQMGRKPPTQTVLLLMIERLADGLLTATGEETFIRFSCSYVPEKRALRRFYDKYGEGFYDPD